MVSHWKCLCQHLLYKIKTKTCSCLYIYLSNIINYIHCPNVQMSTVNQISMNNELIRQIEIQYLKSLYNEFIATDSLLHQEKSTRPCWMAPCVRRGRSGSSCTPYRTRLGPGTVSGAVGCPRPPWSGRWLRGVCARNPGTAPGAGSVDSPGDRGSSHNG